MSKLKEVNVCIAGLGNVGINVVKSIKENNNFIFKKANLKINILGISAKNKNKKRIFNISDLPWFDDPNQLINISDCNIFIELMGYEKDISYEIIKKALENKIHVITANKALLSKHGTELFKIAEENNVLLLFEAAVAGGIPIINTIKQSLFLNKINKVSGILNGTTNFILTEMESKNKNFKHILSDAQSSGYVESDPTNDIEGIDSAHKLSLLSAICFGSTIDFDKVSYKGISSIEIEDIKYANKLGYKIKLISESYIDENKIISVVEPKLVRKDSYLANVKGVLNAIKIETDHLNSVVLEGEGAGGKATASSIISDIYEISINNKLNSLGYKIDQLKEFNKFDVSNNLSPFYLRITAKDIPGVLAKITSSLNDEGISIETILQIPESNKAKESIPIIIMTHDTTKNLLENALKKIEKIDFILKKITILTIDKNFD